MIAISYYYNPNTPNAGVFSPRKNAIAVFSNETEARSWLAEELLEKNKVVKSWTDDEFGISTTEVSVIKNIFMNLYTLEKLIDYCNNSDYCVVIMTRN